MAKKAAVSDRAAEVMEALNAKYGGKAVIVPARKINTCDDLRRPTGITSLDLALGGGPQGGRLVVISGEAGLGKDYLLDRIMANIQRNYGDDTRICLASFGAEHDALFAQSNGVAYPLPDEALARLERDSIDRGDGPLAPEVKEALQYEIGRIITPVVNYDDPEVAKNPAGWLAKVLLDVVKSGVFQLVVLNEVGGQTSKDRAERDIDGEGKKQVGEVAKFYDDFMARYCLYMKQSTVEEANETTLIFLSQVRITNIGPGRNPFLASVGGNHLKHVKSIELMLSSGGPVERSGEIVGKTIKWKVVKGKHGIHDGETGEYDYFNGLGVDLVDDAVKTAMRTGVVTREKNEQGKDTPYFLWRDLRVKGIANFQKKVSDDNLLDRLRADIFNKAGLMFRVR